jgi:hypothetical protein
MVEALQQELEDKVPLHSDRGAGDERLSQGWVVTNDMKRAAASDEYQFTGFVLHAPDERLIAADEAACLSSVKNVRLGLHYVIH